MKPLLFLLLALLFPASLHAGDQWRSILSGMPLKKPVAELTRAGCIPLMLESLAPDSTIKALIFLPGAVDEFYFFHRASATLDSKTPSLLDAVNALESQTRVRAAFHPPFVLLHTAEDPMELLFQIEDASTADRVRARRFPRKVLCHDMTWDEFHPKLSFGVNVQILPPVNSAASFHFYRPSFAAFNLSAWEALEAAAFASKTKVTVHRRKIVFENDHRMRQNPPSNADLTPNADESPK